MITLEKIDQVVNRTGATYKEAKEALEKSNGDVVVAIIYLETEFGKEEEACAFRASDILDTVKEYIRRGNVSKVIVKKDGEVLLNLPVTVGAIAIVLAPLVSIVGVGAALVTGINIYIENYRGEIIDINKATAQKIDFLRTKSEEVINTAEKKASDLKEKFAKKAEDISDEAEDFVDEIKDTAEEVVEEVKEGAEEVVDEVKDAVEEVKKEK